MSEKNVLIDPKSQNTSYLDRLLAVSKDYNQLLTENKIEYRSNVNLITSDFSKLLPEQQDRYLKRLEFSYQNALQAVRANYSLQRDKRYVWRTIQSLGGIPSSNLLDHITESDYIEIYDCDSVQVFANFEFCKLVTYTLEEVTFYPWTELYGRDEKITQQIINTIDRTMTKEKGPFQPDIDDHVCFENRSQSGRHFRVKMKMFSPIPNRQGHNQFFIATSYIERVQ